MEHGQDILEQEPKRTNSQNGSKIQLKNSHKSLKDKGKNVDKFQASPKDPQTVMNPVETEAAKLKAKILKVDTYWKKTSFFIPNVFRLVKKIPNDYEHVFEFQDLSKKEVLI